MSSQSLHSGAVCVPSSDGAVAGADQGRCIGLVDARFMGWMVDPSMPVSQGGALQPTTHLVKQLHAALWAAGLDVDCVRLYWYSDQEPSMPIDGVVFRCVPALDSDAGLSAVRAMSADMVQLAHNKAVDNYCWCLMTSVYGLLLILRSCKACVCMHCAIPLCWTLPAYSRMTRVGHACSIRLTGVLCGRKVAASLVQCLPRVSRQLGCMRKSQRMQPTSWRTLNVGGVTSLLRTEKNCAMS